MLISWEIFFYNSGFDDCFLDGRSLDDCSLRWLLNSNKPKLMAILLALNKPQLMNIHFLYNQDTII